MSRLGDIFDGSLSAGWESARRPCGRSPPAGCLYANCSVGDIRLLWVVVGWVVESDVARPFG
jgi:hypothetical protein